MILTVDCVIKMGVDREKEGLGEEGVEFSLGKCVDIWVRIYRDPRAKYNVYLPNYWIIFIIKLLLQQKQK